MWKAKYAPFLLLVIIFLLIAYGQTLFMYFWQDDSALIFKLQNPEGPAGSFGTGLWQRGAYQYLVIPFVPFFSLFRLEPFGYFFVGFLTYALATLAFYFFAYELSQNKQFARLSTLVFVAGYVGSDTMFRVINSWQTNIGITMALITFLAYIRFLRKHSLKQYLISVVLFLATIEFVFIRSHSIILPLIFLELWFSIKSFKLKQLFNSVVRLIPFLTLFRIWFLTDQNFGGVGISSFVKQLVNGQIEIASPLFANLGNLFIPDIVLAKVVSSAQPTFLIIGIAIFFLCINIFLFKKKTLYFKLIILVCLITEVLLIRHFKNLNLLWLRDTQSIVAAEIGLLGSSTALLYALDRKKSSLLSSTAIMLGVVVMVSQIFGYFTQYPTAIFPTVHRYFSYSFIGYALLWAAIFRKRPVLLFVLILLPNLYLGFTYQSRILTDRSIPSRNFYQDLKMFVPSVQKGSTFYFDVAADPVIQRQFGDFFSVGSMPETTALAIYYGVDRYDITMITDFQELAAKLVKDEAILDKTHTFFYGPHGLVDTTSTMRALISGKLNSQNPITPLLVSLDVESELIIPSQYPFSQNNISGKKKNFTLEEKLKMLEYLTARETYYHTVSATSTSDWKFREVRQAVDNDLTTVWQGHRIKWGETRHEELVIDLGKIKDISTLVWTNWHESLSPTSYIIEISANKDSWQKVKEVKNATPRKNGELVTDNIPSTKARFIRMVITKTATDDAPAILEFEAIENRFSEVNRMDALEFGVNPLVYASDANEWNQVVKASLPIAKVKITWLTDKSDTSNNWVEVPIDLVNQKQTLDFIIPAGGTKLIDIKVDSQLPINIKIVNKRITNLALYELTKRGLIKDFREN